MTWYTTKADLQCECVSAYFITFDLRLFLCAPLYVHLIYAYMAVIIIRPYCRGLRTNDLHFKITFTIVSDDCEAKEGTPCQNGACLDSLCHCNDGYGGCSCQVPGMHVHIYHYHYSMIYGIIIFSGPDDCGNVSSGRLLKRRSADTSYCPSHATSEQW